MKKILVPTDFSDCANAAAQFAIDLAEKVHAEIDFLHLQQTPVNWVNLPLDRERNFPDTHKAIAHAENELRTWCSKAAAKGVKAHPLLVFNTATDEILEHVEKLREDVVLMGTGEKYTLGDAILGSNTQQMIRKSMVPVLSLKTPVTEEVRKVVFVSDFSEVSMKAFEGITKFVQSIEASMDLLFVNTPEEFESTATTESNMNLVESMAPKGMELQKYIINANSVEDGVLDFARGHEVDLIAICTHGKSGLKRLLDPSIAEEVAMLSPVPVLTIKI